MEKITFKGVRVYQPAAYNREKRIKNKIRLILSPALYKSFSAVLDCEYGRLPRIGGYNPKRTGTGSSASGARGKTSSLTMPRRTP